MRIAILSDLHANLPFAESAVRRARMHACDRIVHLGDLIDIGPWPAETIDFLVSEGVDLIRGNHDEYPSLGLTPGVEAGATSDIMAQLAWTHAQLRADHLALLAGLPTSVDALVDEWRVRFQHYLLRDGRVSEEWLGDDTESYFPRFGVAPGQIVCFGHIHKRIWQFDGTRGILNPGATGLHGDGDAWFAVLVVREMSVWVEWHAVESSADLVVGELQRRAVPAWQSSATYMFERVAV